jgi:LPXTG-motif cell wall-anchored protein
MKMKRSLSVILLALMLQFGGLTMLSAQDQPNTRPDTVNMDTEAKPEFYYDVEDEESMEKKEDNSTLLIGAAAAVVIIAGVVVVLRKKKK